MEFWRLLKEGLRFLANPRWRGHEKYFYGKGGVVTIYEFEAKNHPPPTPP
jgi:hypothetical protein